MDGQEPLNVCPLEALRPFHAILDQSGRKRVLTELRGNFDARFLSVYIRLGAMKNLITLTFRRNGQTFVVFYGH